VRICGKDDHHLHSPEDQGATDHVLDGSSTFAVLLSDNNSLHQRLEPEPQRPSLIHDFACYEHVLPRCVVHHTMPRDLEYVGAVGGSQRSPESEKRGTLAPGIEHFPFAALALDRSQVLPPLVTGVPSENPHAPRAHADAPLGRQPLLKLSSKRPCMAQILNTTCAPRPGVQPPPQIGEPPKL